jgi:beta-glucosidase
VSWKALEGKDGVIGINMQMYVTGFPMINAATMTWNPELVEAQHKATGDEFYAMGYNLIAGPVASPLGRDPYGGRLNEGYSPDPYLSGIMMGKAIHGMNAAGVVATGRHYLLNEQETNRMNGGYSANADNKTLHEVYLWPFADAVKNGMMSVMCAMNKVNDVRSCENHWILNGYLKTDLGFPGLVHPDVGSQVTAYNSFNAGLDLGSAAYWSEPVIAAGLANGKITQNRLDDMAIRNVIGYYYVGLDNGEQPEPASTTEYRDVRGNHSLITRQVAQEAIILLKNDNTNGYGLPLNKPRALSLFGAHAGPCTAGPNMGFSVSGTPGDTYEGHLATGGGSGQASFPYLIAPSVPLTMRAAADGGMIWWILNNTYTAPAGGGFPGGGGGGGGGGNGTDPGINGTFPSSGGPGGGGGGPGGGFGGGTGVTPSIDTYSENSDACIVFINSMSGEGADRTELSNEEQDTMVSAVADNCNNTIVVGNFAGPRVLDAWIDHPNIRAVLYSGLLGQESGNAIADVLHGDVNPSGKLTHTIAKNASDYPTPTCMTTECDYTEGVYIDYRYFDSNNVSIRYPFGHGLSYTTFEYGGVTASVTNQTALDSTYPTGELALGGPSDLFDEVVTVQTTIQNTGGVDGAEVAQLYVSFPEEAQQPLRVLRGFSKMNITAGDSVTATFSLRRRDLSYWDDVEYAWAIAKGDYTLAVGSSLEDIRGTATLTI